MSEPTPRFQELLFAVFEALPRQGPGSRVCTARALELCRDLPPIPAVLDLGCGTGGQTLHLAELTAGSIVAIDRHPPCIDRLRTALAQRGLTGRVRPSVGDIARLDRALGSFDLVWSEGAFYNVGIENALRICRGLLRIHGYVAFSDAVWRREDPPPEVRAAFADYPTMGRTPDVLATIERSGFAPVGHFTLPDEAWWDDFYTPMQRRIEELRDEYAEDVEALAALDRIAREPEMHRRRSAYYAYEFFVARR